MPYCSSSPVWGLEKLTLCITYQCTKFEVSSLSHSIDIWECEILKWVTQGYPQLIIRQSAYDFLFNFNRNYASILYHLRDAVLYLSKVANFHHPTCIWHRHWGWHSSSVKTILGIRKLGVPGLSCSTVCVIIHSAIVIQYRLVTDGWTIRHTTTACTTQSEFMW